MSVSSFKVVDGKQVEKILEKGQKLRNAMVETILKNDPFTTDFLPQKHYNTPVSSVDDVLLNSVPKNMKTATISPEKRQLIEAYLKGDFLTKDQEKFALEALKTMSAVELTDATERTLAFQEKSFKKPSCFFSESDFKLTDSQNCISKPCFCRTCKAYSGTNLDCDLRRPQNLDFRGSLCSKDNNSASSQILKYADCLRISLHNLKLNEMGNKKTFSTTSSGVNETFFIEYHLPNLLAKDSVKDLPKNISKVDSGLDKSSIRICSKRSGESVNFDQTFTHNIASLNEQDLKNTELIFKISYRNQKQKCSQILGFARIKFDSLLTSKNLSCSKALAIHFRNQDCPIVVGSLKVTTQLGCGRVYYGKDFVEAINCDQNSETLDSEGSSSTFEKQNVMKSMPIENQESLTRSVNAKPSNLKIIESNRQCKRPVNSNIGNFRPSAYFTSQNKENFETKPQVSVNTKEEDDSHNIQESEKQLLFGFIYISEAQFLNQCPTSYISCQPFCQNETSNSRLVANVSNPLYNFCQKVPLLYDDEFLLQLRENLTLIEFWERIVQTDSLFGVTKVPLHQFYLAYRNSVILQHLIKNKLPVIGTDWWEPIYAIDSEELIGQVQILTALGTEQQIDHLESERGFKNDLVKAKHLKLPITKISTRNLSTDSWRDRIKVNKKSDILGSRLKNYSSLCELPSSLAKSTHKFNQLDVVVKSSALKRSTVDIGVQSDLHLENMENNHLDEAKTQLTSQSQDMMTSFLKILEHQKQQRTVVMESSTNTENNPSPGTQNKEDKILEHDDLSSVKKTTDLLDSLQKALSIDPRVPALSKVNSNLFKAHVSIKSANHLPSRKKMKAKKSKNKGKSSEENILPSTYVTFETSSNDAVKTTKIVPKSTSPQWNYECDVELPTDLLTNAQKRLIFKVWKKSNNVVLQPNMQTDTVLGFAALDLTVLVAGLPNVQGWFNIVDFAGKCNGQINIHVTPLDNLNRFRTRTKPVQTSTSLPFGNCDDEGGDLLSRALKRKFTELDEITQRLRLRLSEVVHGDSENENDEVANEFEQDIDSLCIEEDFDMVNFETDAQKLSVDIAKSKSDVNNLLSIQTQPGSSKESTKESTLVRLDDLRHQSGSSTSLPTDRHLAEGKQRIDGLLEKLSLLSAENVQGFSSRYVSGCSVSNQNLDIDTEHMLEDLDRVSRPNITSCSNLERFKDLYGNKLSSSSEMSTEADLKVSESGSSGLSNFSDQRPIPDGKGTTVDDESS